MNAAPPPHVRLHVCHNTISAVPRNDLEVCGLLCRDGVEAATLKPAIDVRPMGPAAARGAALPRVAHFALQVLDQVRRAGRTSP
jgi:hypothetical protein